MPQSVDVQPCPSLVKGTPSFCNSPKVQDWLWFKPATGGIQHENCPVASEYGLNCHRKQNLPPVTIIVPDQIPVNRRIPLRGVELPKLS